MNASEIQKRLSENLRRIRKERKLTQFALAEKAGISEETIKNVELSRAWPSERTLSQITDALATDVYNLFIPVESSFAFQKDAHMQIKVAIAKDMRNYVDSVLEEIVRDGK